MNDDEIFIHWRGNQFAKDPEAVMGLLYGKSLSEVNRFIREDLSPNWVDDLRKEAIAFGNGHLYRIIQQIQADYLAEFTVSFFCRWKDQSKAKVVRFRKNDQHFYHADYFFDGIPEGQVVKIHRRRDNTWSGKHYSNDQDMVKLIGTAIDWYENYKPLTSL